MEHFRVCNVTPAGTLIPEEGEYTTATIPKVSLQTHSKQTTPHLNGYVLITTHRIAWLDASRTRGISAPLSRLANPPLEDKSSPLRARTLVRFGKGVRVVFESGTQFKDRDRFSAAVRTAWTTREWVRVAEVKAREAAKKEREGEYVPRRIGAAGVVDRVAAHNEATGKTITTSFASIDKLRAQAEEVIAAAKKFQGKEDDVLVNMMAEMGIASPVTRASAGSLRVYREELGRQIGEFLQERVVAVGGVMTVSDAYCVVMRNRATVELVSPEDFRTACEMFGRLGVGVSLARLESGVWAIEAEAGEAGAQGLAALAAARGCVTAVDVVRERRVPLQRARAMLEAAERRGCVCRDGADVRGGVRFYENRFRDFTP